MNEITTNQTVSADVSDVTVKSVIAALRDSGASRAESGFDRLETKDRNAVKKALKSTYSRYMSEGLVGPNASRIQPLWVTMESLDGKSDSDRSAKVVTESDVRARMGERVAMLRFAADALVSGDVSVNGWESDVPTLTDSDIPEVTDEMVEKAMKFANVSVGTKTKENDIPVLIHRFFATVPEGTFVKVSDIRKGISDTSGIHTDNGWDGRINANLFPKDKDGNVGECRTDGVEAVAPGHSAYTNRNGAFRTEAFVPWESDNTDNSDN